MSAVDAQAVLRGHRIVPVYTPASVDEARHVARALQAGGIGAIEVTLRTPAAMGAVAALARECPDMRVGAGTVLEVEQLRRLKDIGAAFAVSPGSTRELLDAAVELQIAYLPGVATGSEVMVALAAGHRLLKVFPAEPINALELIDAWRGPFAQARFCPTGGIDAVRAGEYLRRSNVACLGGSWLTPADALRNGDWARVEALAREAATLAAR
ncbi:bifunctional 4-hydroxy-2-oxoglutarate aldolase/2-dehydro-3-deoxy-phosphogluconate aldolase [Lysobacter arvi]|uniref:2-dehydro-3-deoxy-phosphogluconate aldolase n=1 Tax=Lysobacter arvi TaxID=3038776 RepID=A0ABU1CGT6_9GAMM|nr:bifunctional 4-hydroxy-2-oxoglutarate aldolase/2-dehydro-3-deoxy-phosphogluconate aldolase [Lysobacter arvi]MDR0184175.1 bifunctional 4-hydroxy-2-oxoglutarate aldolase/2-dehydro-3-deoxy-phosphogluconate aldolase [Lysobacter arvi]